MIKLKQSAYILYIFTSTISHLNPLVSNLDVTPPRHLITKSHGPSSISMLSKALSWHASAEAEHALLPVLRKESSTVLPSLCDPLQSEAVILMLHTFAERKEESHIVLMINLVLLFLRRKFSYIASVQAASSAYLTGTSSLNDCTTFAVQKQIRPQGSLSANPQRGYA